MAKAEFSVHLGGGLYMDSNGVLSHGPEPGKPVYSTPGGGLPVDPDALAKAFQGIAKALPDKEDPKSRQKFDKIFDGVGMSPDDKENLINMLQAAGAVASVIGSVVPIVGAILAVLTALLGLFKDGPSALELLIVKRFDELERKFRALEIQIQQKDLRNQLSVISAAVAQLKNYVVELAKNPPSEATLLLRQQDVRAAINATGIATRNLLHTSTWLVSFDRGEHTAVWPWIAHRLFTFPKLGAPHYASFPAHGPNRFDHRLMVPLAIFSVTSFLSVLRASAPEFRSTSENREDLWDFADALEVLAENMRQEGLARTVYTAADFAGAGIPWGFTPQEVIDLPLPGFTPHLAPGNTRFAVGALDLCSHNNAFFTPGFTASRIQHAAPQFARQGLLNVRWIPPARLESYEEPIPNLGWKPPNQPPRTQKRYRITNPEECAQAANTQAEQDYIDLLYSSGYINLIHLVATLRNEATDPDRSQTVRADAWLRRKPGASTSVVVKSEPILLQGVISSPAERQPQQYKATTWFTTQPLSRDRKLQYRVWLRTLHASASSTAGAGNEYRNYHQVGYTNDPQHPGGKMLYTSTGNALDELKIAEGTTVLETREVTGTAKLKASTFDWWIPVKPFDRGAIVPGTAISNAILRAAGWEEAGNGSSSVPLPFRAEGGISPPAIPSAGIVDVVTIRDSIQLSDLIGWEDGKEAADGHRRMVQQSEVHLDYSLHWRADKLTVSLKNNRATDRNYIIYVVVEEKLGSGEVLHTVQRVPVTGQLTFVPQSFFDQEAEAHAKTARFFRDFAQRYAKSLEIPRGPGNPEPGWLGVDPHVFSSDPVLRQFHLMSYSSPADLKNFADIASRVPSAAKILRQLLAESLLPQSALKGILERPRRQPRAAPHEAEAT